jgi:hypothetical protein
MSRFREIRKRLCELHGTTLKSEGGELEEIKVAHEETFIDKFVEIRNSDGCINSKKAFNEASVYKITKTFTS